ncbi:WavQ [Alishewanella sp. 16-MA]|uniref:WavQ n=1 Tax=Alishewanella maricola TaxID=2795740 RepID=A0ABS8C167_9ALTE|nr:WavQ [Alishewanella maricola]MCB5226067.1 WavQ [Alishewanella maricola]
MAKFLIFTPSYNEKSGGVVVLHKLCHILNELGHESYLFPYAYTYEINRFNFFKNMCNFVKWSVYNSLRPFKSNVHFDTPVFNGSINNLDDFVVVYPEVVFGNPLGAKNVVRWLLHQPGFHEKRFYFSSGELIFKFNSAIKDFNFPGSCTSPNELKVIHYPLEHYNLSNISKKRSGYAYCIRKGKGKSFVKDHSKDILIDNLSHQQVAKVFKEVEFFVSYDTYTAYSIFATLCGCKSIVIGDAGVDKKEWYPLDSDRYGIAYGFDDMAWLENTNELVKEHILNEEKKCKDRVKNFAEESIEYFRL